MKTKQAMNLKGLNLEELDTMISYINTQHEKIKGEMFQSDNFEKVCEWLDEK